MKSGNQTTVTVLHPAGLYLKDERKAWRSFLIGKGFFIIT